MIVPFARYGWWEYVPSVSISLSEFDFFPLRWCQDYYLLMIILFPSWRMMGSFQVSSCYLGESEERAIYICGSTVVLNVLFLYVWLIGRLFTSRDVWWDYFFLFPAHVPCVKRMLTLSGRCVSRCCDVLVGKSALLQRYFLSSVSFQCRQWTYEVTILDLLLRFLLRGWCWLRCSWLSSSMTLKGMR